MATSSSISTSYPISVQTPQSDWELQLSQLLTNIGQSQYQWAQNTYNSTSALTDQQINSYLQLAQQGQSLAGNEINRYESIYQPLENQYINEAQTYASAPRIARNMGAAESDTAQAENAGRINAEDTLRSYGIDPSSGRYAELEDAQRTAAGAAEAGAGQQAELATEQTGQQMLLDAVNIGQQYPGAAVNSLNSAYQGVAGAENSILGSANTGVNLMDSANPYFSSAMQLRYPPTGQITNSQSASNNGSGIKGPTTNPFAGPNGYTPTSEDQFFGSVKGKGSNNSGSPFVPVPGSGQGTAGSNDLSVPQYDPNAMNSNNYNTPSPNWDAATQPYDSSNTTPGFDTAQFNPQVDTSYGYNAPAPASWDVPQESTDWSSPQPDYSSPDMSTYSAPDASASSYQDPSSISNEYGMSSDMSGGATSGDAAYYDTSGGDSGGDSGYAQGGGVLPHGNGPTTGGFVPRQASPSMGRNTDDISARLNAGEFVVPRDVAAWKGQEYFQKLIEDSRRKRMGAPAKGKPKAPLNGPPRFASHPMQQVGAR